MYSVDIEKATQLHSFLYKLGDHEVLETSTGIGLLSHTKAFNIHVQLKRFSLVSYTALAIGSVHGLANPLSKNPKGLPQGLFKEGPWGALIFGALSRKGHRSTPTIPTVQQGFCSIKEGP